MLQASKGDHDETRSCAHLAHDCGDGRRTLSVLFTNVGLLKRELPLHKLNRLRHQIYENGRGGIKPPIEPVGQSA